MDLGLAGAADGILVNTVSSGSFLASRIDGSMTGANVNVDGGSDFA